MFQVYIEVTELYIYTHTYIYIHTIYIYIYTHTHTHAKSLQSCPIFATIWTIAH